MKRFYCILILVVCLAGITHAKEQEESEPLLRHRVSLSYGAPSVVGLYTNMFVTIGSIFSARDGETIKNFYIGPITADYSYLINKYISAGVAVGYEMFGSNIKNTSGSAREFYAINSITVMGKFQVKYGPKQVQFYQRLYAGVGIFMPRASSAGSTPALYLPAGHLTVFGLEVGKRVKFFADIGFGYLGLVNAGIMYTF